MASVLGKLQAYLEQENIYDAGDLIAGVVVFMALTWALPPYSTTGVSLAGLAKPNKSSSPISFPRGGFDMAQELWKESRSFPAYSTTGLSLAGLAKPNKSSSPISLPRGGFDMAQELWKESRSFPAYSTTGVSLGWFGVSSY